jgi:hypothetical protein
MRRSRQSEILFLAVSNCFLVGISIIFSKMNAMNAKLSPNGGDCAARGGFYILV